MNTSETYAGPAPRIGLIELPELADALTGFGLQVVTASDFRGGVAAIKTGFATYGAFPLIVTDRPIAGLRAWVERIQTVVDTPVAVVRDGGETSITSAGVIELHTPLTLNAVLAAVGLPSLGAAGEQVFPAPAAAPVGIDIDFDIDFDEPAVTPAAPAAPVFAGPMQAMQTAPVFEAPAPAPVFTAPAPAPEDLFGFAAAPLTQAPAAADPFDSDPFSAPAPGQGGNGFAFSPVAPEESDWNSAPAPVQGTFTPAAQAPVQELSWDAVAAATPVQAQQAPVQNLQQAARDLQWDTIAAAAPAAPVFRAPQAEQGWDTVEAGVHTGQAAPTQVYAAPVQAAPVADDMGWGAPAVQQAPVMQSWTAPAPAEMAWDAAPAPQAQVAQAQTPAAFGGHDASNVFDSFEAAKLQGTGRSAAGLAALVIVWSGKGGVGKSTTSLELAELASETGARVILIDGNCGQGDLRTYLRLNKTDVPTIYNAAHGNIAGAILSPAAINAIPARQGLGEIKFGFVAAPPEDIDDGEIVTNATYRAVIEHCRRNADIVIMDTQIIEAIDRTKVLAELLVPAFIQDAWGVGVADMTAVGVNNLNARLRKFAKEGVAPDRQMLFVNKVPEVQVEDAAKLDAYFRNRARFLGSVTEDPTIRDNMNAGRIEVTNPQMRAALSTALYTVTGNEEFRRMSEVRAPAAAPAAKVSFWGRMTGKKVAA